MSEKIERITVDKHVLKLPSNVITADEELVFSFINEDSEPDKKSSGYELVVPKNGVAPMLDNLSFFQEKAFWNLCFSRAGSMLNDRAEITGVVIGINDGKNSFQSTSQVHGHIFGLEESFQSPEIALDNQFNVLSSIKKVRKNYSDDINIDPIAEKIIEAESMLSLTKTVRETRALLRANNTNIDSFAIYVTNPVVDPKQPIKLNVEGWSKDHDSIVSLSSTFAFWHGYSDTPLSPKGYGLEGFEL